VEAPRVLFFDFDGTLIDSMGQHAVIFGSLLADAFGIDPDTAGRDYLSLAGKPLEAQFQHALTHGGVGRGVDVAALIEEFWRRYNSLEPVLFPEVATVLAGLAGGGHPLVVTTQGRQAMVDAKLRALGVR
jgi:phosphoglycolate phosphatase-like HAD superfamily hydrolase